MNQTETKVVRNIQYMTSFLSSDSRHRGPWQADMDSKKKRQMQYEQNRIAETTHVQSLIRWQMNRYLSHLITVEAYRGT
jgi:hypothetical protein